MHLQAHSYLAFVLAPTAPIYDWLAKLDAQLMRSPRIFIGQPIVLNLAAAKLSNSAISHLIASLEERNIRIMALEGADLTADGPSLPPLLWRGRPVNTAALLKTPDPPQGAPPKQPASLLIEEPIRSGQSIVFADGDVTVLGSVASGADIVAGGSIHVYGALRGRAMAGVGGNPRARIFCNKVEAELLAIDGLYMTAEQIGSTLRSRPVQAWLEGDVLNITTLN